MIAQNQKQHQLHTFVVTSITVPALQQILKCCPLLTNIKISSINGNGDHTSFSQAMQMISVSSVKSIDFSWGLSSRTDILPLHNLTALSLKYTPLEHSDIVSFIARNPNLYKLCLLDCPLLTEETLLYIVDKCKHLVELGFCNYDPLHEYSRTVNTDLAVKFAKLHRSTLKKVTIKLKPY